MTDRLIAIWVVAVGICFALLPLAALLIHSKCGTDWAAGVWDAWRYPYGIVLAVCAAGAAVRIRRYVVAARRRDE